MVFTLALFQTHKRKKTPSQLQNPSGHSSIITSYLKSWAPAEMRTKLQAVSKWSICLRVNFREPFFLLEVLSRKRLWKWLQLETVESADEQVDGRHEGIFFNVKCCFPWVFVLSLCMYKHIIKCGYKKWAMSEFT